MNKELYQQILRLERERDSVAQELNYPFLHGYDRQLYLHRFNMIDFAMDALIKHNRTAYDQTRPTVKNIFMMRKDLEPDRYAKGTWYTKHKTKVSKDVFERAKRQFYKPTDDIPF